MTNARLGSRLWFVSFCLSIGFNAGALATDMPSFQWRGFLTAGYAQTLSDDSYLTAIGSKPNFLYDTRLGVAFSVIPLDKLEVGAQFIAQGAYGNFAPTIDWAFVTYRPSDAFFLRAGKLRFPMWLIADYYHVGYSYLWARPPPEIYALDILSSFFGVLAGYHFDLAPGTLEFAVFGGSSPFNIPLVSQFNGQNASFDLQGSFDNLIGATVSFESLKLRARASYANTWADLNITGSIDQAATQLGPGLSLFPQSVVRIPYSGQYNFWSAGVDWNATEWLHFITEYLGSKFGNTDTSHNGYATLGVPLGWLEPHFTFARAGTDQPTYYRYALGCNFYVAKDMVLKFQWDAIDVKTGPGPFIVPPGHVVQMVSSNYSLVF